jgi:hypothetical protein
VATSRWFGVASVLAVLAGTTFAVHRSWLCDDAFISFRYAANLVDGAGLVFNPGERVEGYTNLLWTLWIAGGLELGISPEQWSTVWGVACFATLLGLLAWRSWQNARLASTAWPVPIAAVLAVCHPHLIDFATSGLETSAFTVLVFAGYLLVCPPEGTSPRGWSWRLAGAGAALALACLTRPDGALFVAVIYGPAMLARVAYYGDLFPNTYYAKSAAIAWWSQGLFYAQLYFERYWPLLAGMPLAVLARPRRAVALEAALVIVFGLYVIRVGGDFMFARMFIPLTPFLLLLLERGLRAAFSRRPAVAIALTVAIGVAMLVTPGAVTGMPGRRGVVDERVVYTANEDSWAKASDRQGHLLRELFDGLSIRYCVLGAEARWVYRSRVWTAIECATGLTDATIARQPISTRGRIGHEKLASVDYLISRRVHFVRPTSLLTPRLDAVLPRVTADLRGIAARVVTWDPPVMAALRARGAEIPDVPAMIDRIIESLPRLTESEVRTEWQRLFAFYFRHVTDPERERPFRERLRL